MCQLNKNIIVKNEDAEREKNTNSVIAKLLFVTMSKNPKDE